MKPHTIRHERRGLWAVIDRLGTYEPNETVAYLTNERDARGMASLIECNGLSVTRPCCLPVVDGSPQGSPCLLDEHHCGRCNAHPRGNK